MSCDIYQCRIGADDNIDDELLKKICNNLNITKGTLIITRLSIQKKRYTLEIVDNYRRSVFSNRNSEWKKFR